MIKEKKSLNIYEVKEILEDLKETEKSKEIKAFIKKFSKISPERAKKIKGEIEKLNIIKLKEVDIAKIIEILPENVIELNKISTEINLDANESNKILEAIKNTK